ncbi:MAG: gamma-glutamylcyclotransferase [Alphaproteobacteria bacterium]|nr:gamma-glutamylcyclotransferase [Alphaproteobacteria bacterium]
MTLHFAYGANMSRAVMRRHAPGASPLGAAQLAGYRFLITGDGYASVVPAMGQTVHGVLWRITPRDRVTLDSWENVDGGLYRVAMLPVTHARRRLNALVYCARPSGEGRPKPGYMELVIAAAREWGLPEAHVQSLAGWNAATASGTDVRKLGDLA